MLLQASFFKKVRRVTYYFYPYTILIIIVIAGHYDQRGNTYYQGVHSIHDNYLILSKTKKICLLTI